MHSDICRILYDYIKSNQYSYTVLVQFLEDIYYNGTKTCYVDPDLEYLQNLIFWITLQEEINYPSTNPRYAGRNLAYCRYVEAIYCTRKMFPLQSGPCVTDVITTKVRGLIYMYCLTVRPFITIK